MLKVGKKVGLLVFVKAVRMVWLKAGKMGVVLVLTREKQMG